jgi:hypothetical protein
MLHAYRTHPYYLPVPGTLDKVHVIQTVTTHSGKLRYVLPYPVRYPQCFVVRHPPAHFSGLTGYAWHPHKRKGKADICNLCKTVKLPFYFEILAIFVFRTLYVLHYMRTGRKISLKCIYLGSLISALIRTVQLQWHCQPPLFQHVPHTTEASVTSR